MVIIKKKKIKAGLMLFTVAIIGFSGISYASSIEAKAVEPEKIGITEDDDLEALSYRVTVPEQILNSENLTVTNIFKKIKENLNIQEIKTSADESRYDLREKIDIEVKNQQSTQECWAFSLITSMELNMKLKYNIDENLSERHMDYATSESFYDGENDKAFNRETTTGGSTIIGLAYLTNGQGAVLENQMPFENNMDEISINDINIDPSYYVTGYEMLPSIYKTSVNGEMIYSDGYGKQYTYDEVCAIRKIIKQHIADYGAITAYTVSTGYEFYSESPITDSKAYYCDNINTSVDHAVTIVGWDDNYSKDNFTGSSKPSRDGAYIVLNSYSSSFFDGGYIYISYEDVWIESLLYGITDESKVDYDNLYQNDSFGANIPINLTSNSAKVQEEYYASVYSRDSKKVESLNKVSIATNQYSKIEVYVNEKNDNLDLSNMKKVATTDILKPGYNTITFDSIELKGDKFAIVVKQTAIDEYAYLMLEAKIDNTFYNRASSNTGNSLISLDGTNWMNLGELGTVNYGGYDIDLSQADVCIKAFTEEKEISSTEYEISEDGYISKIYDNTKINEMLSKMSINSNSYQILKADGSIVSDFESLVQTGMILNIGDKNYTLVVRGDLNGDGRISLVDLSKSIANYTGLEGFILDGAYYNASDINLDGKLSLVDLSQFMVIYNNM